MSGRRKLSAPVEKVPVRIEPAGRSSPGKYFHDLGIDPVKSAPAHDAPGNGNGQVRATLASRVGQLVIRAVAGFAALFRAQPVRTIGQNQMQPDEATNEPAEQLRPAGLLADGVVGAWEDAPRPPVHGLTDTPRLPGRRPPALR